MPPQDPFTPPRRTNNAWFSAGLTSSYPNITTSSSTALSDKLPCNGSLAPGCKVFYVPADAAKAVQIELEEAVPADLKDQVVVFRYLGKFYCIDHVSLRIS